MKKIIYLISLSFLFIILISTTVFGLYQFNKDIDGTGSGGSITSIPVADLYQLNNRDQLIEEEANYNNIKDMAANGMIDGYEQGVLLCYASKKNAYNTNNYVQLKDLSVNVSYKATIETRLRVKIQDTWTSYKAYNGGTNKNEIIMGQSKEAFTFSSGWTYDDVSGYAYYSGVLPAGVDFSQNLFTYSDYEYSIQANSSYRETIYVSLAFQIDVVQANRAEEIWGIDF